MASVSPVASKVTREARRRIHHERGSAHDEGVGCGDGSNGAGKHALIERLFVEDHIGLDATAARRAHGHARGILVLARANPFGAVDRAARLADIAVDRAMQLKHAP